MKRGIVFLALRYLWSRRRDQGLTAPLLSFGGLTVGVLALNTVLAVMNGFQLTFIESLLEVSSSHLRWEPAVPAEPQLIDRIRRLPGIRSIQPFYETQTLIRGPSGVQDGAFLRGMEPDAIVKDLSMAAQLSVKGKNTLASSGQILLGSELAAALGAQPGDHVSLLALTGASFSVLSPQSVDLTVAGTFSTGYYEINAGWAMVSLSDARDHFAGAGDFHYGIKLQDENQDSLYKERLSQTFSIPPKELVTWREFNAAFFGALKTEKTAMMLLVGLIFLVVGVNIFYMMRRSVQEHREDIALFQALGLTSRRIRAAFAAEGAVLGVLGAATGSVLGILLSLAIPLFLSPEAFYLPKIPSRVLPHEVFLIGGAAIIASTAAAWAASRQVFRVPIAEVLKNE